jgi:hypothetical protein
MQTVAVIAIYTAVDGPLLRHATPHLQPGAMSS